MQRSFSPIYDTLTAMPKSGKFFSILYTDAAKCFSCKKNKIFSQSLDQSSNISLDSDSNIVPWVCIESAFYIKPKCRINIC